MAVQMHPAVILVSWNHFFFVCSFEVTNKAKMFSVITRDESACCLTLPDSRLQANEPPASLLMENKSFAMKCNVN